MRGNVRARFAFLVAVALIAVGCGGDDTATGGDAVSDEGNAAVDSGDGSSSDGQSSDAGATPMIGDLAVPLAPGAAAVATTESGPFTIVQYIVPLDQMEAAIAFYDDWTDTHSDAFQRTEAEAGGVSWQNSPEQGADKYLIAVTAPIEGDDFTTITFTGGPAE
jgi:hypothetical protein